jgi:hypothetical protein
MAKRSSRTFDDQPEVMYQIMPPLEEIEVVNLGIDPPPKITYNRVVNTYPSRIIRTVNGNNYEWQPGETILVKSEDTNALRNLTMGARPCCGHGPSIILQVLED